MIPLVTAEDPMTYALSLSEVGRHVVSLHFPFTNIVEDGFLAQILPLIS
jgi:hypothetical protein